MITIIIIIATVITSVYLMNDKAGKHKLCFYAYDVSRKGEYYRFLSHGFIHADYIHLGVNMYVLFLFGQQVEYAFAIKFGALSNLMYLLLYFASMAAACVYSYFQYKDSPLYRSLGASGAVSAVMMVFVLFYPLQPLGLLFLPGIDFYAIVFGILYLLYSSYSAKNSNDNVEHNAHLYGAIFGVVFTLVLDYTIALDFFGQIMSLVQ